MAYVGSHQSAVLDDTICCQSFRVALNPQMFGDCDAGGVTPRRITSVGYCVGGSVASLAAVFAALQCPTADVRCITFGSQLVGNAAFAEAFR